MPTNDELARANREAEAKAALKKGGAPTVLDGDPIPTLATIPDRYSNPDPSTLATLPKGGTNLSYMGHAEVTLALIDVDPLWTWEPFALDASGGPLITHEGNRLVMWGRLTVLGKTIVGVGTCEARKGDPEKELIGDFLRNAAMRFGIGTKLWSKATTADPAGRTDEPTYSKAALDLYEQCRSLPDAAKADLKAFATENQRKVSVAEFDNDRAWREMVASFIAHNKEGK